MSIAPRTFRAAALGVSASAFLAMGSLFPACAQQVAAAGQEAVPPITLNTDCTTYRPGVLMADTQCRIEKSRLLEAQGKALDAQLAKEKQNLACMRQIQTFFGAGKVSRAKIIEYGKDRMCELVKTLG